MAKQFYIADWHYDHKNVIHFDNRPFSSIKEMNKELIERWNKVVSADDVVYILGDMFWCKVSEAIEVLNRLNGKKVLIRGNHDSHDHRFIEKFDRVYDYLETVDGDRKVVLCHYPIPCFKNHFYGWYHLYGHVHNSFEHNMMEKNRDLMGNLYDRQCEMYNVGAMMPYMDYTPRTLDEIIDGYKFHKELATREVTDNDKND